MAWIYNETAALSKIRGTIASIKKAISHTTTITKATFEKKTALKNDLQNNDIQHRGAQHVETQYDETQLYGRARDPPPPPLSNKE
ncbi:hypothetical protein FOPG_04520 [Fusarium oxysporum f. sp. conglutinans race 2 54008]|uniref:Uncharacterized protein n=1 Tax=Fusarium oxysporum f. sp. conglutinans race 2 54008 TaxID=1089457 RepID=X0I1K8_FUSOX|nr:hypothetical protein FOPG_04520 [Fusarium oxysporum f. sp. conglutinans race 2 54008]